MISSDQGSLGDAAPLNKTPQSPNDRLLLNRIGHHRQVDGNTSANIAITAATVGVVNAVTGLSLYGGLLA